MKKSKLKVAAIMLMAALLITSCGKDTNEPEELSLRPTVESGGNQGLTEVFQMHMIYDAFVEDYIDHFDFNGFIIDDGNNQISFNPTMIGEEYISSHHEEIGILFEECREEALEDEINFRMPKFADVTSWFPSDVAFDVDGNMHYYKIEKVEMHPTTQAVDESVIDNVVITGAKKNSYGSMVYAAGFSFWFFGEPTESNNDAVDLTYVEPEPEETVEPSTEKEKITEPVAEVEEATEEAPKETEYLFSEYLSMQENIWLEFDPKAINGNDPDENTPVIGILITSPNGTCFEARTPLSNFGTWGELEKKTDKEIKAMAKDFVSDISNYEMTLNMSDDVKAKLKKYIQTPHPYTLTGMDVNEWRNIENYLVLTFESTTPSVKGVGAGNDHEKNGADEDFIYYVTQQNIEFYGDNSGTEIGDSTYAVIYAKKSCYGVIATRVPEGTKIKKDSTASTAVIWNPEDEIYPEKTILTDNHYVSPEDAGKREWDFFDRGYKHEK